ncbi:hypothetical protein LZ31DRAFT_197813 [Colletotrichum somersetense]|nr:hypothetical protein LZ31DRAFT_197813 [Colletotrichum somersetense]
MQLVTRAASNGRVIFMANSWFSEAAASALCSHSKLDDKMQVQRKQDLPIRGCMQCYLCVCMRMPSCLWPEVGPCFKDASIHVVGKSDETNKRLEQLSNRCSRPT